MYPEIAKFVLGKFSQHPSICKVMVKDIVRITTYVEGGNEEKMLQAKKDVYAMEIEVMDKYPEQLFDFDIVTIRGCR